MLYPVCGYVYTKSFILVISKTDMTKLIPVCLLALSGCELMPTRIVEVPVRVSCVAAVPATPSRLTPCPPEITNSQCVKRSAIDIERLDSALDQSNKMLKACI